MMCGVSPDILESINPDIDIQNLQFNQRVNIFPEKHFKLNTIMSRGAYVNSNQDEGKRMKIDDLRLIGIDFYRPIWKHRYLPTNIIVEGGALSQIKEWFKVVELVQKAKDILKSKKSCDFEFDSWGPGSITDYPQDWIKRKIEQLDRALDRTWEDIEDIEDFFNWVHVIGSFAITIRKHADETKAIVTVYDSKTLSSGTDNRFSKEQLEKYERVLTPTYQRYIWVINL